MPYVLRSFLIRQTSAATSEHLNQGGQTTDGKCRSYNDILDLSFNLCTAIDHQEYWWNTRPFGKSAHFLSHTVWRGVKEGDKDWPALTVGEVRSKHTFPAPLKSRRFSHSTTTVDLNTKKDILIVLELCLESVYRAALPFIITSPHTFQRSIVGVRCQKIPFQLHMLLWNNQQGFYFVFRFTLHKEMKSLEYLHSGEAGMVYFPLTQRSSPLFHRFGLTRLTRGIYLNRLTCYRRWKTVGVS